MRTVLDKEGINAGGIAAWLVPAITFWLVIAFEIPYSLSQYFSFYTLIFFLAVFFLYYLSFRLEGNKSILAGFGLTMLLLALTLSYLWTSGYSDNFVIGGLLPYKDAKNYYQGANQLLNGQPIRLAVNAVRRPLFSGFLSSLFLFTGQNLKLSLAVLSQLVGIGLYLSARQVRVSMGALAGAVYITFSFFYIQFVNGYVLSESLGFIGGCFAFALLWYAAQRQNWFDLSLGLGLLMMAISARAGTFFIFPMLVLWAGWIFRGQKRFSLIFAALALISIVAGYFILNTIYPYLLGIREGSSFGNFSFTLYGQVRGGIGWHSAIDELGTSNPSVIYQAAWEAFLATPSDLFKGVAKAYADFFLPGGRGIFMFGITDYQYALNLIFWSLTILILFRGVYLLVFKLRTNISTLLLAGFVGILLSIPFLPPIDGGGRFYASSMPFFFVLLAVGVSRFVERGEQPAPAKNELFALRLGSVSLLALTVLLPPVTLRAISKPAANEPVCSSEQRPFMIDVNPGSYIDLVKDGNAPCGLAPKVCYDDFLIHNTEMQIDSFYQDLDALVTASQSQLRIIPTLNQFDGYFHYFIMADDLVVDEPSQKLLSGCATRLQTETQRVFRIESISTSSE